MAGAQNVISYANSHTELDTGFKEITDDPEVPPWWRNRSKTLTHVDAAGKGWTGSGERKQTQLFAVLLWKEAEKGWSGLFWPESPVILS